MPQNKNALTRYALLDRLLSNHRKAYSIQDLTDYLAEELPNYGQEPVTRRCVEKDIIYLELDSPFNVEFERYKIVAPTKSGDGSYLKPCIRYADPSFSIFKKPLSEDERSLLASVLSTIVSFKGQPNFEWLEALAQKLNVEELPEVISMSKNINENSTLLAELFAAISSKSAIDIHYHTFSSEETKTVSLSPYLLKEYNCRWYLLASPFDSDRVLSFALDRIDGVEYAQELTFKPAKVNVPQTALPDRQGGVNFAEQHKNMDYDRKRFHRIPFPRRAVPRRDVAQGYLYAGGHRLQTLHLMAQAHGIFQKQEGCRPGHNDRAGGHGSSVRVGIGGHGKGAHRV